MSAFGRGCDNWVEPYINELVIFPNGRFDDQVDSLVQALPRLSAGLIQGAVFVSPDLRSYTRLWFANLA